MIQLCLAGGLLILLVFFEIDIQYFENWRERAAASPYYDAATGQRPRALFALDPPAFATTTLDTLAPDHPAGVTSSRTRRAPIGTVVFHARWGMVAAIDMVLTAVTGWAFYLLAFVA